MAASAGLELRIAAPEKELSVTDRSRASSASRSPPTWTDRCAHRSRAFSHIRSDGGFGFWPMSKKRERWLTILSLDALYAIRDAGLASTTVDARPCD